MDGNLLGENVFVIRMYFFATECPDGTVHVQNYVQALKGQHHVHSKESFERWRKKTEEETGEEVSLSEGECDCGLKAGDCRECDGYLWHNEKWE